MTTENNPGQLFTAVDVDFTNITKHRDISQMNRSKPFQQFDPEKHHFCFAISCIVKTKMQMLSLNENHKDWSLLNFPLSHHTHHSTCLSPILTFQPSTTASPSAWSPSPLPWPSSPSTSTTWVCAGKM